MKEYDMELADVESHVQLSTISLLTISGKSFLIFTNRKASASLFLSIRNGKIHLSVNFDETMNGGSSVQSVTGQLQPLLVETYATLFDPKPEAMRHLEQKLTENWITQIKEVFENFAQ